MVVSLHRDAEAYLRFLHEPVVASEEVWPGVVLDYAADGRMVGIEVRHARTRLPPNTLGFE